MRLDGVIEVETDIDKNQVTVIYDDTKVNYEKMKEALIKAKYPPKGQPRYLK